MWTPEIQVLSIYLFVRGVLVQGCLKVSVLLVPVPFVVWLNDTRDVERTSCFPPKGSASPGALKDSVQMKVSRN